MTNQTKRIDPGQHWFYQLAEYILPALTLLLGMQSIRALLPYLQYLLGDRFGWTAIQLGLAGLTIYLTAFLTNWLNRRLGLRRMLTIAAGGVGLIRLAVQLWSGDPLGDMALLVVGTGLFILSLPAFVARVHWQSSPVAASHRLGLAFLLGLAVDTTLHGTFLTYDLIWQTGVIPLLVTTGLVLIQWIALRASMRAKAPPHPAPVEGSFLSTLPLLAIGPFLFLQLLVFQNQARLATLTDWSLQVVFGWVLISHLLGLSVAAKWEPRRAGAVVAGSVLVISATAFFGQSSSVITATALLIGQVSLAVLMTTIFIGLGENVSRVYYTIGTPQQPKVGLRNTTIIYGTSTVLLVGLIFAFYAVFSLHMPYQNGWLPSLAGLVIAISGVGAANISPRSIEGRLTHWIATLPLLLLCWPLYVSWTRHTPNLITSGWDSLRLFDYNVHSGFNTQGHLDMETLARVIEAQQPDLVTLQEVSRGWVINGSLDMLGWLGQRLDMSYAHFTPASDALWGQAVLSRYPILIAEDHPLPPRDLPLKRSFVYLQLDVDQPEPLHLINTHLHHPVEDSAIRLAQVKTVLDFLADRAFSQIILTGDLNATPDAPEIQLLYARGFRDAVIEANLLPGYTFSSTEPHKRLDYILISSDLNPTDVIIPPSTASDHLGIATTITKK